MMSLRCDAYSPWARNFSAVRVVAEGWRRLDSTHTETANTASTLWSCGLWLGLAACSDGVSGKDDHTPPPQTHSKSCSSDATSSPAPFSNSFSEPKVRAINPKQESIVIAAVQAVRRLARH